MSKDFIYEAVCKEWPVYTVSTLRRDILNLDHIREVISSMLSTSDLVEINFHSPADLPKKWNSWKTVTVKTGFKGGFDVKYRGTWILENNFDKEAVIKCIADLAAKFYQKHTAKVAKKQEWEQYTKRIKEQRAKNGKN